MAGVLGNRGSDCRACTGGNAGGGCDSGFSGQGFAADALDVLGSRDKSMLGVGLLITVIRYWPALFERYFTESVVFTERLLHLAARHMSENKIRETYTTAAAKSARTRPGGALP